MSHRFKPPSSADVRKRRELRRLKTMASEIKDQATLDLLLQGADLPLRKAMVDWLKPHLSFTPKPAADCPRCGKAEGTAFAHDCLLVLPDAPKLMTPGIVLA